MCINKLRINFHCEKKNKKRRRDEIDFRALIKNERDSRINFLFGGIFEVKKIKV